MTFQYQFSQNLSNALQIAKSNLVKKRKLLSGKWTLQSWNDSFLILKKEEPDVAIVRIVRQPNTTLDHGVTILKNTEQEQIIKITNEQFQEAVNQYDIEVG